MSDPERGDLIQVDWVDIFEDPAGDPHSAELLRRTSFGLFWDRRDDDGIPVLVTTTTLDPHDSGQQGYCIYPSACVTRIKVIKRKRRQPRKSSADNGASKP
jgi:hypothetical protein